MLDRARTWLAASWAAAATGFLILLQQVLEHGTLLWFRDGSFIPVSHWTLPFFLAGVACGWHGWRLAAPEKPALAWLGGAVLAAVGLTAWAASLLYLLFLFRAMDGTL